MIAIVFTDLVMRVNGHSEHGLGLVKTGKDDNANPLFSRFPVNFVFNVQKGCIYSFYNMFTLVFKRFF